MWWWVVHYVAHVFLVVLWNVLSRTIRKWTPLLPVCLKVSCFISYSTNIFGTCFLFAISQDLLQLQKERCSILFSSELQNQRISEKVWSSLVKGVKSVPPQKRKYCDIWKIILPGTQGFCPWSASVAFPKILCHQMIQCHHQRIFGYWLSFNNGWEV